MTDELKPCPFCGGEAYKDEYEHDGSKRVYIQVACEQCDCRSGSWQPEEQAIKQWNTRTALERDSREAEDFCDDWRSPQANYVLDQLRAVGEKENFQIDILKSGKSCSLMREGKMIDCAFYTFREAQFWLNGRDIQAAFSANREAELLGVIAELADSVQLIMPLAKGYRPEGQTDAARNTCNRCIAGATRTLEKHAAIVRQARGEE